MVFEVCLKRAALMMLYFSMLSLEKIRKTAFAM